MECRLTPGTLVTPDHGGRQFTSIIIDETGDWYSSPNHLSANSWRMRCIGLVIAVHVGRRRMTSMPNAAYFVLLSNSIGWVSASSGFHWEPT
jgi:hypothetical protein